MRALIEGNIDWRRVGNHRRIEYEYFIQKAVMDKERKILRLEIRLNFVIPIDNTDKIEKLLLEEFPDLTAVHFLFDYHDMVVHPGEIFQAYIPYAIREIGPKYAPLTKAILPGEFTYRNNVLTIMSLGDEVTKELNEKVAEMFEALMALNFNLLLTVKFCNKQERYDEALQAQEEKDREEIRALEQIRAMNRAKAVANAGAFSPGEAAGGFGSEFGAPGKGGKSWKRRKPEYTPVEGNLIMGSPIVGEPVRIAGLDPYEDDRAIIRGKVFKKDQRVLKNGKILASLFVSDGTESVCVKCFVLKEKWEDIDAYIGEGTCIRVRGNVENDSFENATVIMAKDIETDQIRGRQDNAEEKRVELHAHTKMSALDGLNEVSTMLATVAGWGHKAIAITDHGVVQAFPEAAKYVKKKGLDLKVIYGMEGYLLNDDDQEEGEPIDYKSKNTYHIILLAANQEGLKNLYKLVSFSHMDYFYKRPRIPKSVLSKYREGLILGSACEAGEVFRGILEDLPEERLRQLASYYDYLEIQPLINNQFLLENGRVRDMEALREINRKIVALGKACGKPVAATCDSHYTEPEESIYRKIIMAGQGYKDAENGEGLYLRTTEEMLEEFAYLGAETSRQVVIEAPAAIAAQIDHVKPVPSGKFPPKIENAEERLRSRCIKTAEEIYGSPLPPIVGQRLEKELSSIIDNGYAVLYVAAELLVQKSLADGYLVGSRGSVGSSLAATMGGITEVNPLPPHYICTNPDCKHSEFPEEAGCDCGVDLPPKICPLCGTPYKRDGFHIPFETFLGFEGDKEPDIDLNFAGEYQPVAHKYIEEIFGPEKVFRAGTIGTVADKTAYGFVKKYAEEKDRYMSKWEVERLAKGCVGVRRTTGQHPGGIIILPRDREIYEFCPVQRPANDTGSDIITTHFEYHSIDENLLKLDILGHDVPSMIHMLQEMTGVDPLTVPLSDPRVQSLFNGTEGLDIKIPDYGCTHGTYGIPEFGTQFVRQMLDDTRPTTFADLVRISGFSHGTDVWLNNAQDFIRGGQATIKDAISTRDDIMNDLIAKGVPAQDAFRIMEKVRKGGGVKDEDAALMAENGVAEWYIESCRRIKYMFPKAHAVAYVMMAYRVAYYKVYYPEAFYAASFTLRCNDFNVEAALSGIHGLRKRMAELREKGKGATQNEENEIICLELIYEMYARGYEFLRVSLEHSEATKFKVTEGKIQIPFMALEGLGENAARNLAEEVKKGPFFSIDDMKTRTKLNSKAIEALTKAGVLEGLPESDQLSLF